MHQPYRPRRLRSSPILRDMLADVIIEPKNLIQPLFVKEGLKSSQPVKSMPGIFQHTLADVVKEAKSLSKAGIQSVILFGIPQKKDKKASGAHSHTGIVQKAIAEIKNACPNLFIISDVCLCEYMEHGHCGVINSKGDVENDISVSLLADTALSHVKAGADMVAPSDMMDGRVGAIRSRLDAEGFQNIPIMSYAVKYASSFYGPFRDAAESAPSHGDRKSYQMDYRRSHEALTEAWLDVDEGADIIMVKPAMAYLDIVAQLKAEIPLPLAAYQVSGEYAMIKAAAKQGWIDEKAVVLESLTAIKRAGASLIISYFAKDFCNF
ncbi:porphobilinogen synthase [bacterium]|nr:porphobilinogen synthase [bacterium]